MSSSFQYDRPAYWPNNLLLRYNKPVFWPRAVYWASSVMLQHDILVDQWSGIPAMVTFSVHHISSVIYC